MYVPGELLKLTFGIYYKFDINKQKAQTLHLDATA